MKNILSVLIAAALSAFTSLPSQALAFGDIRFANPVGEVSPTDDIDIDLTFTLSSKSEAILVKNGALVSGGFSNSEIEDLGLNPADIIGQSLNFFFTCAGDTFGACTTTPYFLGFSESDRPYFFPNDFSLQPGQSASALIGTFSPRNGPAPLGTYSTYNQGLMVLLYRKNLDGPVFAKNIAQTCPSLSSECSFSRTVVSPQSAVPEPSTWALMILGFFTVGYALRTRKDRRSAVMSEHPSVL